jgi:hypothetical protein
MFTSRLRSCPSLIAAALVLAAGTPLVAQDVTVKLKGKTLFVLGSTAADEICLSNTPIADG